MSYYLLPKNPFLIHKYIDYIESDTQPTAAISNSLSTYLSEIKQKIDYREKDWDIFKKYTNPYEYVHSTVPYKKLSVAKAKPLSRSFFKMVEIIQTFHLATSSLPINTFHLAEGPGGFIEAISMLRKNKNDIYIGMTLMDEHNDPNIPGWKKTNTFLKQNPNVYIERGLDGTGNILSVKNLLGCKDAYKSSIDFITADGGFDFSFDFNSQEVSIAQLLFAQVCYAVTMQKKGGTFVLKVFDCFMQHTMDILCILSSFYDKVYITKPNTSRYANSEKYIVCKHFLLPTCEKFFPFIQKAFEKMIAPPGLVNNMYVHRFLSVPLPLCFVSKLEEYNAILGQQQIENIHYTILLIDNKHNQDKVDTLIKMNIQKCMQWCVKHELPYNIITMNPNVFLQMS
jgi:23S rRNA U2552 (ribose-2'-O)-methylase RlmE/FtsJ